jgi:hypothetical protein
VVRVVNIKVEKKKKNPQIPSEEPQKKIFGDLVVVYTNLVGAKVFNF